MFGNGPGHSVVCTYGLKDFGSVYIDFIIFILFYGKFHYRAVGQIPHCHLSSCRLDRDDLFLPQ